MPDGRMRGVQYRTVWNASARYPVWQMTKPPTDEHRDQDAHKGAMEEGRPQPPPNTGGLDKNGLPNNATVIATCMVRAGDAGLKTGFCPSEPDFNVLVDREVRPYKELLDRMERLLKAKVERSPPTPTRAGGSTLTRRDRRSPMAGSSARRTATN